MAGLDIVGGILGGVEGAAGALYNESVKMADQDRKNLAEKTRMEADAILRERLMGKEFEFRGAESEKDRAFRSEESQKDRDAAMARARMSGGSGGASGGWDLVEEAVLDENGKQIGTKMVRYNKRTNQKEDTGILPPRRTSPENETARMNTVISAQKAQDDIYEKMFKPADKGGLGFKRGDEIPQDAIDQYNRYSSITGSSLSQKGTVTPGLVWDSTEYNLSVNRGGTGGETPSRLPSPGVPSSGQAPAASSSPAEKVTGEVGNSWDQFKKKPLPPVDSMLPGASVTSRTPAGTVSPGVSSGPAGRIPLGPSPSESKPLLPELAPAAPAQTQSPSPAPTPSASGRGLLPEAPMASAATATLPAGTQPQQPVTPNNYYPQTAATGGQVSPLNAQVLKDYKDLWVDDVSGDIWGHDRRNQPKLIMRGPEKVNQELYDRAVYELGLFDEAEEKGYTKASKPKKK